MGHSKLRGKDLSRMGINDDAQKSIALDILSKHFKKFSRNQQLDVLAKVLDTPADFINDNRLAQLAQLFLDEAEPQEAAAVKQVVLRQEPKPFAVFGKREIEQSAIRQMEQVMKLPVAENGALMPDAHQGYGLPIGGVLTTKNSVLPFGVGMDIGCRMSLSILDAKASFVQRYRYQVKQALLQCTHFGIETLNTVIHDHEVLDREEFKVHKLARKLHGKAHRQLGTSGSGNHFVEVGEVTLYEENTLGLEAGEYVGILSHSGSRGFGAEIARTYTDIAMKQLNLPKGYKHLAWLDLDTEAGQEYWQLMNLAGDWAAASHEVIHRSLAKNLGLKSLKKVENFHNFAWKECIDHQECVVHRKGATPAGEGVYGIIPGSMTAPGFIVRGLGNEQGLLSAAHGAGRKIPRQRAKATFTGSELRKCLREAKVDLIGGQVDEAPMVYKDIHHVMAEQEKLVAVEGKFQPRVVRMDKR